MPNSFFNGDHSWFKQLFELSPDPTWIIYDNRFVECNEAAVSILGYRNREELLNTHPSKLSPPKQPDMEDSYVKAERMMAIAKDQGLHRFEWVHTKADGTNFIAEVTLSAIELRDRKILYCIWRDITERKRAAEALNESEARFRSLTEMSSDFYWESDAEHRLIARASANRKLSAVSAFQRGAQIGERRWDIPHLSPDDAGWQAHRADLDAHRPFRDFELSRLGVDGTERFILISGDPVFDSTGAFKGYRGIGTDITARKQSENALRESEHELRAIFDGVLDGIVVADADSRKILAANSEICSMLGYTVGEILDLSVPDIHPESGMQRVTENFNRMLSGNIQLAIDMPVMRKDGSVFYADIKAAPVRLGGKDAVLGVFRDTTERARSEQQLVEAEAQYRGLVEQSIAGIYIIQDGKFAYVNPRCAEVFGYDSAEEMIGRDSWSVVAEKDRDTHAENIRRRIEGEVESINYEFTGLRKNGTTADIGVHGARATHKGRPAIIGLIQDISEKKRAADEIQRHLAQLETAFMSTVEVATTLGEMRDPYTAGHQRRAAELMVAIGAELGFDARRQEGLRVAGYLHDIGKITIPAEILSKPGKLSAIEFQLIQAHPRAGYDVLKNVTFPWPVADVALQHHERMDGSGYPQGLKGEAILLEARIMAVADVVEAMSTHRPYRPGLGLDKTLAEIERGRGSAYDPEVADACLKLFRENGYTIRA